MRIFSHTLSTPNQFRSVDVFVCVWLNQPWFIDWMPLRLRTVYGNFLMRKIRTPSKFTLDKIWMMTQPFTSIFHESDCLLARLTPPKATTIWGNNNLYFHNIMCACDSNAVGTIAFLLDDIVCGIGRELRKKRHFRDGKGYTWNSFYATCFQQKKHYKLKTQQSNRINVTLNIYVARLYWIRGRRGNGWNKSYTYKLAVNYFINIEERLWMA